MSDLNWNLRDILYAFKDSRLPVFMCIYLHKNTRNRSWPSNETIAKETGLSNAPISAAIQWLINSHTVVLVPFEKRVGLELKLPNRKNIYQLTGVTLIKDEYHPYMNLTPEGWQSISDDLELMGNSLLSKQLNNSDSLLSKCLDSKRKGIKGIALNSEDIKNSADAPVSFQSPNPSNTNTSHSNAIKGSSLNGTKKRSEKSPRKKKLTALEQAKLDMQPFREVVHQMAVMCKAGYDVMGDIDHSLSIPEMTDYTLHASEYMRLGGRAEDVKDIYEYIASDETRTANIAPVSIVKGLLGWKAAQKAIEDEKKIDQAYEEAKSHVETLMTDEQRKKRAEQMKADRIAIFGEKTA